MRSVPFKSVLHWVAGKMLGDPDRMRDAEAADYTRYINEYVRKGWERDNWPEWTIAEERRYRPAYSAETTYAIGDQVYHTASATYARYVGWKLLGNIQGIDGDGGCYVIAAPNSAAPEVGGRVRRVDTSFSGTITEATGTTGDSSYFFRTADIGLQILENVEQIPASTIAGLDGDWEAITDLHRYISLDQAGETPIGTVIRMSPLNPEEHPGTSRYRFTLSSRGVQVPARAGASVWLQFRLRPPTFTSAKFNSATIYTKGQLVYWLVTGECYERTAVPDPEAEVPHSALPSATAQWTLVPFPYVLAEYVQRAAYAEALDSDGQADKSARQADLAEDELALEWSKSEGQQDQTRPYSVGVRSGTTRRSHYTYL